MIMQDLLSPEVKATIRKRAFRDVGKGDVLYDAYTAKRLEEEGSVFHRNGRVTICIIGEVAISAGVAIRAREDKDNPAFAQCLAYRRACDDYFSRDTGPGSKSYYAPGMHVWKRQSRPVPLVRASEDSKRTRVPANVRRVLPKTGALSEGEKKEASLACDCPHTKLCCSSSRDGIYCTRPKGHTGPHIACGVTRHNILQWPQE